MLFRSINEMVARTSTESATWTLVEGNDKPFARVKVLRTLCAGLREGLQREICTSGAYVPCGNKRPVQETPV